jgi:2-amino-4-hydroxy-6-hydroxymethyldihydropteridine diphosphokinase
MTNGVPKASTEAAVRPSGSPVREDSPFEGGQNSTLRATPTVAYLSLGSNVGERQAQLRHALDRLKEVGRILAVSSFYETEPVEFTEQRCFLNCAAAVETDLTPEELMASLLCIEEEMGRRRVQKKGPRIIDLDILFFGGTVVDSPELKIPHPAMHERRFVLEPLAEIAAEAIHPVLKKSVRELQAALPEGQAVRKLDIT